MPLNHFTDSVYGIAESGVIYGSWGNTAVFGDGVYFTSYPPSTGQAPVAQNNWDGIWEKAMNDHKMEGVIKIYDYKNSGHFEEVGWDGRDVWLCRTQLMDLSNYEWAAFTIEWSGNYLKRLTRIGGNH